MNWCRVWWLIGAPLLLCAASPVQRAPKQAAEVRPLIEASDRNVRGGSKLYARECASCHGEKREGVGKAPPLAFAEVEQAPPGTLYWVLTNGSMKNGMPSFAHLPDRQRWQIVAFLRAQRSKTAANN
jgi:mono/diheme cytochrome c family protein